MAYPLNSGINLKNKINMKKMKQNEVIKIKISEIVNNNKTRRVFYHS